MKKCPFCRKGELKRQVIKEKIEYKDHNTTILQPGEYCSSCQEGVIEGADLKFSRKAVHDWQAKIDGFLDSDQVRTIRKKLGLTQHQAAKIFGGGPNAFSRYESGQALQMLATDNLLRILENHPELLLELQKKQA